jgi:hypothetical protein
MAKSKTVRVYPDGDVWVVKRDGVSRAAAVRNTKREALEVARDIALNRGSSITIHGKDGKIQRVAWPTDQPDEDCFITTSCVRYLKLSDDCYQLSTLRQFRDQHLRASVEGTLLVKEYYQRAPHLVALLERDRNKRKIYEWLFLNINQACHAIQSGDFDNATKLYVQTVLQLSNYLAKKQKWE